MNCMDKATSRLGQYVHCDMCNCVNKACTCTYKMGANYECITDPTYFNCLVSVDSDTPTDGDSSASHCKVVMKQQWQIGWIIMFIVLLCLCCGCWIGLFSLCVAGCRGK